MCVSSVIIDVFVFETPWPFPSLCHVWQDPRGLDNRVPRLIIRSVVEIYIYRCTTLTRVISKITLKNSNYLCPVRYWKQEDLNDLG